MRSGSLDRASEGGGGSQSIEEIYTKLGELDHILKRPDTFVGSTEKVTEEMVVYDEELQLLRPKTITYVPGLCVMAASMTKTPMVVDSNVHTTANQRERASQSTTLSRPASHVPSQEISSGRINRRC